MKSLAKRTAIVGACAAVCFILGIGGWDRSGGPSWSPPPSLARDFFHEIKAMERHGEDVPAAVALPSRVNGIGMELVLIPAGEFIMGSQEDDNAADSDEKPAHRVRITKPFYLGKYEVTQAQWRQVMGDNPSYFQDDAKPVEQVSWNDTREFIKRLNAREGVTSYRLPTEAEWEYAARAGGEAISPTYPWGGDESRMGDYAWYYKNSGGSTHPVGRKKANAWGLYDTLGNVWEWVADRYGQHYYRGSPENDLPGASVGALRVIRGGGWGGFAKGCRPADRNRWREAMVHGNSLGFRLAQTAPEEEPKR